MKNKLIMVFMAIAVAVTAVSCGFSDIISSDNLRDDTPIPLPPHEYFLYLNNELVVITGILESHMSNAKNVLRGEYPADRELANIGHSLELARSSLNKIEIHTPAIGYEAHHDEAIRRVTGSIEALEEYEDTLAGYISEVVDREEYASVINGLIGVMKGDFVSVKSLFLTP